MNRQAMIYALLLGLTVLSLALFRFVAIPFLVVMWLAWLAYRNNDRIALWRPCAAMALYLAVDL